MADILIRGISIPAMPEIVKQGENVPYIDVRIFADGSAVTSKGKAPYYAEHTAMKLPPHGRLIDADKLEKAEEWRKHGIINQETVNAAPTIIPASIEDFPAADVRPVVICENCKHCLKMDEHEYWCKVHSPMHLVRPDDWCSRGEERDDG